MILNNFRKEIIEKINQSGLSIDCVYFVLKDVLNDVIANYNKLIEAEEQKEKIKKEEVKKNG